jgi:competence protein ComEC
VALLGAARLVDVWPWLSWRVPPPETWALLLFYTSAAMVVWAPARSRRLRRIAIWTMAMMTIVIAVEPFGTGDPLRAGWLRLTAIDVGQGDALLLQVPSGPALLVDAGPASEVFDSGGRVVTPAVWALGVRRLAALAVTHADQDHIGGAAAMTTEFHPAEIWEGPPVEGDPARRILREAALAARAGWRQLQAADHLEWGAVRLDVLSPPAPDWERRRVRNDDSLVLRVRYGDAELLLTGDIGTDPESAILAADEDSPARLRVLKVAHHGSRTSTSQLFLRRYAPQVAIVSAGRGNPFGHPSPDVLARLQAIGAHVFRTDRDGAVIVETNGREVDVSTMTGERWTLRETGE